MIYGQERWMKVERMMMMMITEFLRAIAKQEATLMAQALTCSSTPASFACCWQSLQQPVAKHLRRESHYYWM